MPLRFFAVPALDPREAEAELNGFLRSHRVVAIERRFSEGPQGCVWCLAVEYLEEAPRAGSEVLSRRGKLDYKELLAPEEFARFARLRDWRRRAADALGQPVFALFTNEQLAEIARQRPESLAALGKIEGIGAGKLTRFGVQVLETLGAGSATGLGTAGVLAGDDGQPVPFDGPVGGPTEVGGDRTKAGGGSGPEGAAGKGA
jgi:hypothetical protein